MAAEKIKFPPLLSSFLYKSIHNLHKDEKQQLCRQIVHPSEFFLSFSLFSLGQLNSIILLKYYSVLLYKSEPLLWVIFLKTSDPQSSLKHPSPSLFFTFTIKNMWLWTQDAVKQSLQVISVFTVFTFITKTQHSNFTEKNQLRIYCSKWSILKSD